MNKQERKEWDKKRKVVINELKRIEKKYGPELLKKSMLFKLDVDRQKSKAEAEIVRLEGELEALRRGKRLY